MSAIGIALGGVAQVYCVHDREKRKVTELEDVIALGREIGVRYDPKQHKTHKCACCENLFVDASDVPRLCHVCLGLPVHAFTEPLPAPIGVI